TPTKIDIPKHNLIGRLIGHEGCNLKLIAEETGTYIRVINTKPAYIEIKIDNKN
ncbi:hypothetical protein C1646_682476, partial [Rhizophagus diaphanus]